MNEYKKRQITNVLPVAYEKISQGDGVLLMDGRDYCSLG